MRLLIAMSADGYVCKGPDDDMTWTGPVDKAIFRLLTLSDPGPLLAGRVTAEMLPRLPGRTVLPLSRKGLTLEAAHHAHPNAWLIGGPNVAVEALSRGLVKSAYICRSPVSIYGGWSIDKIARLMPDKASHTIKFGDVHVLVFTRDQQWPAR
jgi:dihydrofolate reductase